jgi:acetyl-CoA carboxylase biotin carboxyl carrier protein
MWKLRLAMARKGKGGDDNGSEEPLVAMARGLAEVAAEHNLSELILDTKDVKLTVRRGTGMPLALPQLPAMTMPPPMLHAPAGHSLLAPTPAGHAPPAAAPAPVIVEDKAHVVTSPFVGTFYRKPNPDSSPYVQLGDRVDKGQVLCIVEAMKLMNEIEADVAGTISAILVEDNQPVEYGQALFKIG